MVTGFQFLVITIFFYLVTSVTKIGFECVHQISNRRKSCLCCTKFNALLVYCQSTKNSPSHLWVQLCCNRLCDYFLPKQDKVELIHVQPLNNVWDAHYSKSKIFVQKFNFDKTPTFSQVFTQNFFDNFSREIKVVNS